MKGIKKFDLKPMFTRLEADGISIEEGYHGVFFFSKGGLYMRIGSEQLTENKDIENVIMEALK